MSKLLCDFADQELMLVHSVVLDDVKDATDDYTFQEIEAEILNRMARENDSI